MKHLLINIFLVLSFIDGFSQEQSEQYNTIKSDFDEIIFKKQYVFSEKNQNKSINDLLNTDSFFTFQDKEYINQGIYNKSHWIKINLINNSKGEDFIFEFKQTNIDSLNVFLVKNKKVVKRFKTKGREDVRMICRKVTNHNTR